MNPSKRRGTAFEVRLVEFLRARGYPHAKRNPLAGKNDVGDIAGVQGWTIEAKNRKALTLAQAMDEARREHARKLAQNHLHPDAGFFCVIANRLRSPLGRAYVVVELDEWLTILNLLPREDMGE